MRVPGPASEWAVSSGITKPRRRASPPQVALARIAQPCGQIQQCFAWFAKLVWDKSWEWAVIERESRKFNTLTNASKARHDIAMNAIRNLKG